jgi:hypothetical protein
MPPVMPPAVKAEIDRWRAQQGGGAPAPAPNYGPFNGGALPTTIPNPGDIRAQIQPAVQQAQAVRAQIQPALQQAQAIPAQVRAQIEPILQQMPAELRAQIEPYLQGVQASVVQPALRGIAQYATP